MNRWMDDDVRQRRNTGFLPAGAGTRRDGMRPIQAQDAMRDSRMELGPDAGGMAAGPDAGAPMRPPMEAGADGRDRALASREIMMGARSGAGPLKGRAINDQQSWSRHIRAQIAAEHPPEHAPVAGAYARQMEAGRPGLVPVRDRERYNAWSAQRAAADRRAERSAFRREQARTDLELRRADVDARRMGNELKSRQMMGEEEPWNARTEVVNGHEVLYNSPNSVVLLPKDPPPLEDSVGVFEKDGEKFVKEGPGKARLLPRDKPPMEPPQAKDMPGRPDVQYYMETPNSARLLPPTKPPMDADWEPPTRFDPETGMTMYQPAPGAPWRHAARDPYADRAMSAEQRERLVRDQRTITASIDRAYAEADRAWTARGREQKLEEAARHEARLAGVEAALSGRSGGRGREMMEDGPDAGAERGLDASEAMMGAGVEVERGLDASEAMGNVGPETYGRGGPDAHKMMGDDPAMRGVERPSSPKAGQAKASGDAAPAGYVLMEAPDGSRQPVMESMVEAYRQRGAKVIDPEKIAEHRAAMETMIVDLQGGRN